jgi:hypothetical protein
MRIPSQSVVLEWPRVAKAIVYTGSRETAPEATSMIPSIPRTVEARLSVEVRKAPSLPEAKKEERRFVSKRRVA